MWHTPCSLLNQMILGHEKNIEFLKRLADQNELAHGYIFHGPSHAGRKLVATCLANYLETGSFSEPSGTLSDLEIISSPPGGTIGISEARDLKTALYQSPVRSRRRTMIIDDADRLTDEAQNALLKIAEEPPQTGLLILVVNDLASLEDTLRSRMQAIYFGRVKEKDLENWLKDQGMDAPEAARLTKVSGGLPGLAMDLHSNEDLEVRLTAARRFLASPRSARKELIKVLIEPETFSLREFLDDVIYVLSTDHVASSKVDPENKIWHNMIELRKNAEDFGLNPRLQLEAIFTDP